MASRNKHQTWDGQGLGHGIYQVWTQALLHYLTMNTITGERLRVYICGPMRGIKLYNFPAFDAARDTINALGHVAINPADLDRAEAGFDPARLPANHDWNSLPPGFDMQQAIDRDLEALRQCEAIVMLPGWEKSTGATAEAHVAKWRGIKEVRI